MILQNIFKFQAMNCFEIITNIDSGGEILKSICKMSLVREHAHRGALYMMFSNHNGAI